VTSGPSPAPLPAGPLALPLLRARLAEISAASGARQLSISRTTTLPAAHALRAARGRYRQEDLPALGASTRLPSLRGDYIRGDCIGGDCIGGGGHARNVRRRPRRGWITIPPALPA
jgi:hypothetical protein